MRDYEYIKTKDLTMLPYTKLRREGHLLTADLVNELQPEDLKDLDFSVVYVCNRGDSILATYTEFDTVYRLNDKTLQLSDDGSVYVEPKPHQYVKINGGDPYYVESASQDEHVITMTFIDGVDVTQLDLSNPRSVVLYSVYDEVEQNWVGFTTTYRVNGQTVQLSDDGSQYDEEAAYQAELAAAKSAKISALSSTANSAIVGGVDVEINGTQKHFSYGAEDQQNLKAAFDLSNATKMSVPYHADGDTCALFTPEQIATIYIAEQLNLTHHQTYFNQLKQMILVMTTIEDVNAVTYGQQLTGTYLETYNAMMAQTQAIINALIGG